MAVANKNAFMLSSATLMIAPAFTTDVFALTPDLHSVGMAREITCSVDSSLIELKNGVSQVTIDSKRTGVTASITATIFEYSAKNMLTALSLDTSAAVAVKRGKLTAQADAAAVSLSIVSDPVPGDTTSAITAIGDIPAGSKILIQRPNGDFDYVFPTVTSGPATGAGPFVVPIAAPYVIPTGMSFPVGSQVWVVTPVAIANTDADTLYGVKITGTLSNFNRPLTVVYPKVRVTKGFNLTYSETDYGSMPWELSPLLMTASEATGRLAEISAKSAGVAYVAG